MQHIFIMDKHEKEEYFPVTPRTQNHFMELLLSGVEQPAMFNAKQEREKKARWRNTLHNKHKYVSYCYYCAIKKICPHTYNLSHGERRGKKFFFLIFGRILINHYFTVSIHITYQRHGCTVPFSCLTFILDCMSLTFII